MRKNLPHITSRSLRSLRLRAGLTQEELAALVGLEKSYISHLETGKRSILPLMKWALFSILGSFDPTDYLEYSPWSSDEA